MKRLHLMILAIVMMAFSSQAYSQSSKFDLSLGFSHALGGHPFKEAYTLDGTYRFSQNWGITLDLGLSSPGAYDMRTYFGSLRAAFIPLNKGNFRLVPAMGFGLANSPRSRDSRYTNIFFDYSLDAQYFITRSLHCGVEMRYMTSGYTPFSGFLLGMKLGYAF